MSASLVIAAGFLLVSLLVGMAMGRMLALNSRRYPVADEAREPERGLRLVEVDEVARRRAMRERGSAA